MLNHARATAMAVAVLCASSQFVSHGFASEPRSKTFAEVAGSASWYGKRFHGRKTASGERFDQTKLTAAHKTLPFGTVVRVTNRSNGKSVEVKINDRGPFSKNRLIDLSHGAASRIGMISSGTARVSMQVVQVVN